MAGDEGGEEKESSRLAKMIETIALDCTATTRQQE